jgi:serine/threonine protein kinase
MSSPAGEETMMKLKRRKAGLQLGQRYVFVFEFRAFDGFFLDIPMDGIFGSGKQGLFFRRREDFELQKLLGKGSYANVYQARSRHSGRLVALKIIDKQLIASCSGLAERVRAEAETQIMLDHPSIVK